MKKLLLVSVALLLLASILAGCTSETTTAPTTSAVTTTPAGTTTTTPAGTTTTTPAGTTKTTTPAGTTTTAPALTTTPATITMPGKYGNVLREVSMAVPSVIGWPAEAVGANGETPQVVFDSFLRSDVNGNYYPWLAESYDLASDFMSITFKLREDVNFHDGSHLTADVAKWNLDNMIAAKQQPYWDSVEVLGDYTVRINFKQWRNTMFATFADGPATWMCSKEAFDKNGIDWMRLNPVGTGPFIFVSFQRDTSFVTVRNPDWWNKGLPYVGEYEIIYVSDPTTQLAVMEAKEADVIGLEPGKMAYDLSQLGLTVDTGVVSIFGLVPDTANKDSIWADKKFREAVEYAIDRTAIADSLGYGYLQAPNQLPPRTNPNYDPTYVGRPFDLDTARQLLAESSYTPETPVKIIVSPLAPTKDAVLAIQAYLAEIGVQVQLDFPQWSKYVTLLNGTWESGAALFQVFPALGGANYNATLGFYFDPLGGKLQSWEKTEEFVNMLNASALSPEVDPALIRSVLNYIQDNCLIIPIHEAGRSFAYQTYVKGGDWLLRSMTSWKSIELVWIDK